MHLLFRDCNPQLVCWELKKSIDIGTEDIQKFQIISRSNVLYVEGLKYLDYNKSHEDLKKRDYNFSKKKLDKYSELFILSLEDISVENICFNEVYTFKNHHNLKVLSKEKKVEYLKNIFLAKHFNYYNYRFAESRKYPSNGASHVFTMSIISNDNLIEHDYLHNVFKTSKLDNGDENFGKYIMIIKVDYRKMMWKYDFPHYLKDIYLEYGHVLSLVKRIGIESVIIKDSISSEIWGEYEF